jgi:hypothetical protein
VYWSLACHSGEYFGLTHSKKELSLRKIAEIAAASPLESALTVLKPLNTFGEPDFPMDCINTEGSAIGRSLVRTIICPIGVIGEIVRLNL